MRRTEVRDGIGSPGQRLTAVLTAYAHIAQQTRSHDTELVKFLHPDEQIPHAQHQLHDMVRQLIASIAQVCGWSVPVVVDAEWFVVSEYRLHRDGDVLFSDGREGCAGLVEGVVGGGLAEEFWVRVDGHEATGAPVSVQPLPGAPPGSRRSIGFVGNRG
jgi:hypothetical protein